MILRSLTIALALGASVPALAQQGQQLRAPDLRISDIDAVFGIRGTNELIARETPTRIRFQCVLGRNPGGILQFQQCQISADPPVAQFLPPETMARVASTRIRPSQAFAATNPSGPIWFDITCISPAGTGDVLLNCVALR